MERYVNQKMGIPFTPARLRAAVDCRQRSICTAQGRCQLPVGPACGKRSPLACERRRLNRKPEFVEVVVKMRMLNAALVSSDQPSFEQRGHEVDARHDFVSRIGAIAHDADWRR